MAHNPIGMVGISPSNLQITLIGAGALGSFFAACFASRGIKVGLVARGGRLERIRREGISFDAGDAIRPVAVPVSADCTAFPDPQLIILCTKTLDLADALRMIKPVVMPATGIVTLQNGVEAPDQAAAAFPDASIIAARVHGFFQMDGDGVRHVGVEPSMAMGVWNGPPSPALSQLAACLDHIALSHTQPADIRRALWEKFLLADAIGGVGLALGVNAGQIRHHPQGLPMLEAAMQEIIAVAAAKGIFLGDDCAARTLDFIAGFPGDATSSFQRDVEAGRPSEYDHLTGAVLRFADAEQIAVPVHREIAAQIKARGLL